MSGLVATVFLNFYSGDVVGRSRCYSDGLVDVL